MARHDMTPLPAYLHRGLWDDVAATSPVSRKAVFHRAYDFCAGLIRHDASLYPMLVRLFGSPIQAAYLTYGVILPDDCRAGTNLGLATAEILFGQPVARLRPFINFPYSLDDSDHETRAIEVTVHLGEDMLLPWPWNRDRLATNMTVIGRGRPSGEWRHDPLNHRGSALWPLRIATIHGGNHSITSGILQRQGVLPLPLIDVSPWIERYQTDGTLFRDMRSGKPVSRRPSLWWAVLWELSRVILVENLQVPSWPVRERQKGT